MAVTYKGSPMWNSIKAWWHVNHFVFIHLTHHNWLLFGISLLISIAGFVLWVLDLLELAWPAIVIGIAGMAKDIALQLIRWAGPPLRLKPNEATLTLIESVVLSKDYRDWGFVIEKVPHRDHERIVRSRLIDRHLRTTNIELTESWVNPRQLDQMFQEKSRPLEDALRCKFADSLRKGQLFINEEKVCLDQDLGLDTTRLTIWKGSYYHSFLTNELSTQSLETSGHHPSHLTDLSPFPATHEDGRWVLKSLSTAQMSNHLGASVLAITQDGQLIIWRQSGAAIVNRDLLVSTGSGSANWQDWTNSEYRTLNDVIRRTMERELREESGLFRRPADIRDAETRVLGYFRWLRRGGKPEFVGVTHLRATASDLQPNTQEVDAPGFHRLQYPAGNLEQLRDSVSILLRDPRLSVSLWMNLLCLQEWIEAEPDIVKGFLHRHPSGHRKGARPGMPLLR